MRKLLATSAAVLTLTLVSVAPAAAGTPDTGAGGAGQSFGGHHAMMAKDMTGLTGDMNPGVHHQGFSNWDPSMPMP